MLNPPTPAWPPHRWELVLGGGVGGRQADQSSALWEMTMTSVRLRFPGAAPGFTISWRSWWTQILFFITRLIMCSWRLIDRFEDISNWFNSANLGLMMSNSFCTVPLIIHASYNLWVQVAPVKEAARDVRHRREKAEDEWWRLFTVFFLFSLCVLHDILLIIQLLLFRD